MSRGKQITIGVVLFLTLISAVETYRLREQRKRDMLQEISQIGPKKMLNEAKSIWIRVANTLGLMDIVSQDLQEEKGRLKKEIYLIKNKMDACEGATTSECVRDILIDMKRIAPDAKYFFILCYEN